MTLQIEEVLFAAKDELSLPAIPEDEVPAEGEQSPQEEYGIHANAVSCQLLYTLGRELAGHSRYQGPAAAGNHAFIPHNHLGLPAD